ncbi:MAG: S9 family peptidase [Acidimicrobiales bacterium]
MAAQPRPSATNDRGESVGLAATGPVGTEPPVPERRRHVLEAHGDRRVDDWYWLADREDPAVVSHLRRENAHAEAVLAPQEPLRQSLYDEIVARIDQTDLSVPVRRGPWWYYQRTREGKSYPLHCRRPVTGDDPPLDPGPVADEEVLLDQNALAEGHAYFEVGNLAVSPAHRWLAYATDATGAELYDLRFQRLGGPGVDAEPGPDGSRPAAADETVPATYYGLAWANDEATVFYTRVDDAMRPYQVWRHRLGTDPGDDVLVLEEADERFTVSVGRTKDGVQVVVAVQSHVTSEAWLVPADDPTVRPRLVEARRTGIEYGVEHHAGPAGEGWLVVVTNDGAEDFRVMAAPVAAPGRDRWHELVPHRSGTRVEDVDVFDRHLVISERDGGEPVLRVVPIAPEDLSSPGNLLPSSWVVAASEHPSVTWEGPNPEPGTPSLRIEQTSLVTPRTVLDVDLATGDRVVRKRQAVLGGYDPGAYRTARLWTTADDGTAVPLSVVHRADLLADPGGPPGAPLAAPAPCLLYGYGAYEHSIDPVFSSLRLSLLDRGVVFAIAHVRGGGELGRRWYLDGKTSAKGHTFSDFAAAARHLIGGGFTTHERLAIRGGSAGGLLIGAVLNQAPELFGAAVAEVPFVDCLTTMLDESLPLTVGEWDEWGNPVTDPEAYATMKDYSPYDNVAPRRYPPILATAGLNDPRVGYWEPAKWVARLRAVAGARAVLRTELEAGHGGPSGRYDAWRDEALVYAFVLDALGAAGPAAAG